MSKAPTQAQLKQLAMQWKAAAPALRAQRHADIRNRDNAQAILSLDSLFREAIKQKKPTKTSGLVEMYKVLMKHPELMIKSK